MISIISPVFDCDGCLENTLNYILNQDFQNFELILINASDSYKVLKDLEKRDKRIKVFSCDAKENLHIILNNCIHNANGKYIYFWDYQFKLDKKALTTLFNLAEENKLDYLIFNYSIKSKGRSTQRFRMDEESLVYDEDLTSNLLFAYPISNGNNFILKSFLEDNVYFNGNFKEFFFNLRFTSKKGMILNKSLATVNKHKFDIGSVLDDFEEIISLFNRLYENKPMFEFYKMDLLKYVLQQLKNNHDILIEFNPSPEYILTFTNIKNSFFNKLKLLFDKFYFDYALYEDIKKLNDPDLIEFFNKFLVNNGKYRFSIVIPVYNSEKYLEETFNSIINQTLDFKTIEVILVDDCSSDNSPSIIKKYSEKYSNFKSFFLEENSSYAGRPRNIALTHVSSKFVSFLDADDYYYEDACENMYYTMINYDADVVIGNFTIDVEGGEKMLIKDNSLIYFPNLNEYSILEFNSIKSNSHILHSANVWNKMFKVDIIEENNIIFPEGVPAQDTAFLFRFLLKSDKFLMINKVVTHYHSLRNSSGDQSVTHRKTKLNTVGRLEVYQSMYNASLESDMEEHFVKNLLVNKLVYLFSHHIQGTTLSDEDIKEIFEKYHILYKKCLQYNVYIPKKYSSLFKNIANLNYDGIIKDLNLIKSK